MRHSLALLTLAACLLVPGGGASAQAPDCSGISPARAIGGADYVNLLSGVRITTGLTVPVAVTSAPGDFDHLYVLERAGRVRVVQNGSLLPAPFLDIQSLVSGSSNPASNGEQGLLGIAFSPDYQSNSHFFVFFTDGSGAMRVVRYTALSPTAADPTSIATVIAIPQPASNHNGGTIAFSPIDGYLYIGTGDGGGGCDTFASGQDITAQRLGKMLRIDVSSLPYTIPADNPYVGTTGDDEIWSYGLRNPFRFSFDRVHGTLLIGDVGQNAWEEVSCAVATSPGGENYGWKNYEGDACPSCGAASCVLPSYVAPIITHQWGGGDSVIGGYVYQGCRMPELRGTYFYANFNSSTSESRTEVRTTRIDETDCSRGPITSRFADLKSENPGTAYQKITGFGEDQRGELYFVDMYDGELYKILPNLRVMQVSGAGAVPLSMGANDWVWEDLQAVSSQPISEYRVFRADNDPIGTFECVHSTAGAAVWSGGDPEDPGAGEVFYYLIQGRNPGGDFTFVGFRSDGTPRLVNNGSACP